MARPTDPLLFELPPAKPKEKKWRPKLADRPLHWAVMDMKEIIPPAPPTRRLVFGEADSIAAKKRYERELAVYEYERAQRRSGKLRPFTVEMVRLLEKEETAVWATDRENAERLASLISRGEKLGKET